jgi:hypothetical protein
VVEDFRKSNGKPDGWSWRCCPSFLPISAPWCSSMEGASPPLI